MSEPITIVDRGRGLQLSTSRVTVQDLVPYFQEDCTYEEIQRWIPTLSRQEIAVVERYYREHQPALDEEDRRIRERQEEQIRLQRQRFPAADGSAESELTRLKELLSQRRGEKNGEGNPG